MTSKFNYDRLHIGCGGNFVGGWLNIDLFPWDNDLKIGESKLIKNAKLLKWDLREPFPTFPNSVKYIYASHLIEHLPINDGKLVLENCLNILEKGGIMRIAFPDLKIFAENYLNGNRNFYDKRKEKIREFTGLDLNSNANTFSEIFYNWDHKWMYDHESLSELMNLTGFSNIQKRKLYKSCIPDIGRLEFREKDYHTGYMEAEK